MKATELIEALQIITKYEPDALVDAQHDEIFAGTHTPEAMTTEDKARLEELDWGKSYESWHHFT